MADFQSNKSLTLEAVQKRINDTIAESAKLAKEKGLSKEFEAGIEHMRKVVTYMHEIAKLGDTMGMTVDEMQSAITLLGIFGGLDSSVMVALSSYNLFFMEKLLQNPVKSITGALFQQQAANA